MQVVEDVVIVGAGISGLTTALGLHRLGIRSLVLESFHSLRITGFALTTWTNAWKALDAIGVGDYLRQQHLTLLGNVVFSRISGLQTFEMSFKEKGKHGDHENRCVKRKLLLEALASELPSGTIRFSSKVVSIEESGYFKLVHLADGTILKAKILVGCDGVNSVVAKWLGFKPPVFTGRSAIRGCAEFKSSHEFDPMFMQYFGNGVRSGTVPCDDKNVYWFFTWSPSSQEKELEENPAQLKRYMLSKLGKVSDEVRAVVENTDLDAFISSPLRYRHPWELIWGNISKGNVCVAGDALHPMTPDIGQGGCAALEDGVVLARCLGEALLKNRSQEIRDEGEQGKVEYKLIERGLNKYASERKWRSFDLISTAYVVGFIQEADGKIMTFLRDKFFSPILAGLRLKKADYDCELLLECPRKRQGGCAALEDGVVLARCLGEALLKNRSQEIRDEGEQGKVEYKLIERGLNKYASERKWRSFDLISTAYVVGFIQEADGKIMTFLRDKFFSPILAGLLLKKADYDCGKLRSF